MVLLAFMLLLVSCRCWFLPLLVAAIAGLSAVAGFLAVAGIPAAVAGIPATVASIHVHVANFHAAVAGVPALAGTPQSSLYC
jgi:hypothetical protein